MPSVPSFTDPAAPHTTRPDDVRQKLRVTKVHQAQVKITCAVSGTSVTSWRYAQLGQLHKQQTVMSTRCNTNNKRQTAMIYTAKTQHSEAGVYHICNLCMLQQRQT